VTGLKHIILLKLVLCQETFLQLTGWFQRALRAEHGQE